MAGKTISGGVYTTVTLGSSQYPSPLTITTAGKIVPPIYGQVGIYLPQVSSLAIIVNHGDVFGSTGAPESTGGNAIDLNSAATLNNSGLILAGAGGDNNYDGASGGIGVDVQANVAITNSGQIDGGGGSYGFYTPGVGGDGVFLAVAANLTNYGGITGGYGGRSNSYNNYAYRTITGGIGLATGDNATVKNTGHITGGEGGIANINSNGGYVVASSGGEGVSLGAYGTLTNSGSITGGAGGVYGDSPITGGDGGDGVDLTSSTASNSGLIRGGAGTYGFLEGGPGGNGVAVTDYGIFNNTGKVVGGAGGISNVRYGGAGGNGVATDSYGTVVNHGNIYGGAGGSGGTEAGFGDGGLQGGDGGYVLGGLLTNFGTVTGGIGASTPGDTISSATHHNNAGYGGDGIDLGGFYFGDDDTEILSAANYSLVHGGVGGNITSDQGTAGNGGYGVLVNAGIFTNHSGATIAGGSGGSVGPGSTTYIQAGEGGAGAFIEPHSTLINGGTINGGAGGTTSLAGGIGGAGVFIYGGTFIANSTGVIRGGAGGKSGTNGAAGDAVYLGGTLGGTLVVNPGASLVGNIVADSSGTNVLEIAGSSSALFTGFSGFEVISFASGATRSVKGTFNSSTSILGFGVNDSIVLQGFASVPKDSEIATGSLILSGTGGTRTLTHLFQTTKDIIVSEANSTATISAVSSATAYSIGSEMALLVATDGTATGSLIETGGVATIQQRGTILHPTLAGGTLVLGAGATVTPSISFTSVTGGELVIDSTTMPTATISGFIAGDTIDLAGVTYNKSDLVTVGTAGYVTITGPGTTEILRVYGATAGESDFKFSAGSLLTRSPVEAPAKAATMDFLRPEAAATPDRIDMQTGFKALAMPELLGAVMGAKSAVGPAASATLHNTAPALIHGFRDAVAESLHPELRVQFVTLS